MQFHMYATGMEYMNMHLHKDKQRTNLFVLVQGRPIQRIFIYNAEMEFKNKGPHDII